jgi:hypothetical protein
LSAETFPFGILPATDDGITINRSPAVQPFQYATDQDNKTGMEEADPPAHVTLPFHANDGRPDQMHEVGAVAEFPKWARTAIQHGLTHLKNAMDGGLSIAELHYHLFLDERTSDLERVSSAQLVHRVRSLQFFGWL